MRRALAALLLLLAACGGAVNPLAIPPELREEAAR